jgi:uncharacterized FlgJ-related protein
MIFHGNAIENTDTNHLYEIIDVVDDSVFKYVSAINRLIQRGNLKECVSKLS